MCLQVLASRNNLSFFHYIICLYSKSVRLSTTTNYFSHINGKVSKGDGKKAERKKEQTKKVVTKVGFQTAKKEENPLLCEVLFEAIGPDGSKYTKPMTETFRLYKYRRLEF